ncbi:MAG: hypothetical protein ACPL7I_02460, partial [Myxococcota bacterium]
MKKGVVLFLLLSFLPSILPAQSLEDIQLKKKEERPPMLDLGFLGTFEGSMGINADRPEYYNVVYVAPQLKIGQFIRAQLNMTMNRAILGRQENAFSWTPEDFSLEFAHLKIYKEPFTGISLSARARYYIPTSKQSQDANSYGQMRGYIKFSYTIWRLYFAAEFNAQKYFNEYYTWNTKEEVGTEKWYHQAGKDEYVENNTSYGFGETYTGSINIADGLDFSLIWGMYQSQKYSPDSGHPESSGSSYLQLPRSTVWGHTYRFAADLTYGIGSIPAIRDSETLKGTPV